MKSDQDLQAKIREAMLDPANVGEMPDADRVGEVGNSSCGEMMRLWIKFKEENGRKVIDRATFQSFGCETAVAVASMATQLIRGKTSEEALALGTEELSGDLGPLPPMKIHCAELVEGALRAALEQPSRARVEPATASSAAEAPRGLVEDFMPPAGPAGGRRVILLEDDQRLEPGNG